MLEVTVQVSSALENHRSEGPYVSFSPLPHTQGLVALLAQLSFHLNYSWWIRWDATLHLQDLGFNTLVIFIAWKCGLNKWIRAIFVVNRLILDDCTKVQGSFIKLSKFKLNSPISAAADGLLFLIGIAWWGKSRVPSIDLERDSSWNGETLCQEVNWKIQAFFTLPFLLQ